MTSKFLFAFHRHHLAVNVWVKQLESIRQLDDGNNGLPIALAALFHWAEMPVCLFADQFFLIYQRPFQLSVL